MSKLSNIDLAYEFLKSKSDSAQFKEIWDFINSNSTQDYADRTALMASLYSELVCDNRFSLTPDGSWALKNNPKVENIKKLYNPELAHVGKYRYLEDEDDSLTTQFDEELDEEYEENDDEELENYEEDEEDFGDGNIVDD